MHAQCVLLLSGVHSRKFSASCSRVLLFKGGNLLEMQHLRPPHQPPDSESASGQGS